MNTRYRTTAAAAGAVYLLAQSLTASAIHAYGGVQVYPGVALLSAVVGPLVCMRMARKANKSAWWAMMGALGMLFGPLGCWLAWNGRAWIRAWGRSDQESQS